MDGFWERYQAIGRCAIDPGHTEVFLRDETRWETAADGESRRCRCRWCGSFTQILRRYTVQIERTEWVAPHIDAPQNDVSSAG